MKATEIAAWWGACIATIVLLWDFLKWKMTGPRINVSVLPDMQTYGDIPTIQDINQTFLVVEVTNTGDRATTLTHLLGYQYKTYIHKLINKKNQSFFVGKPALAKPLPYILKPGERWMAGIIQNEELEIMSRVGNLYCGVIHTSKKKPVLRKVTIKEV